MNGGMLVKNEITEWDPVNNIKRKNTMLGEITYDYSNTYRLIGYLNPTAEQSAINYVYDQAGNRDSVTVNGTLSDYDANNLNQVTLAGTESSFTYDLNGNLTGRGGNAYSWDYNNRLAGAVVGSKNISYKYNYQDIRLEKSLNGAITRYYYNGAKLLAEGDGTKITKIFTNDDEGVLGMTRKIYDDAGVFSHFQNLHYLFDNLGSIVAITDDSGKPVQYYQYDPYGQITNTETDPVNSLTFVGRYYGQKDWDTGFVYFWHRWYDSNDGRWISRDPIGVRGGVNVYEYAKGNMVNHKDPQGLYEVARTVCDSNGWFTWIWIEPGYNKIDRDCIIKHEEDHIRYFANNFPDACLGQDRNSDPMLPLGPLAIKAEYCSECSAYKVYSTCVNDISANKKNSSFLNGCKEHAGLNVRTYCQLCAW